jgi:two-component system phosphate regulon sensor histidine kinase PhoR
MELPQTLIYALLLTAVAVALGVFYQRAHALQERINEMSARAQNRQALETQVRALESRSSALEALMEAAYNALLLIDPDHQIVHMNAAACDLFHCPPEETRAPLVRSMSVMSLTRQHELDDLVAATLADGEPVVQQVNIQARPYQVRAEVAETPGGPVVVMALEDVSELQRLGRARRDMVANISHELRTPITTIRVLVDTLLRRDIEQPEKAEKLVEKISVEVEHLHQIAQELLDLAMIESGRAEFMLEPTGLWAIAADVIERMGELAQRQQHEISNEVPDEIRVLADKEQVTRVLTNLLHNAIKFTPPGGRIVIGATPNGEWVTVNVTDDGPGVPMAERDRIFERFYRSDRAREGGGTGLGLAIAKHIVGAHGGRIWAAEPPASHTGAHICFTLPAAEG